MDRQHGGNARDTEALVKTRRAILLGGAGLAAAAAGSLAAAAPAKAANGEDVVLGATNMASSSTDIVSTGTDETLTVVSTRAIGLFAYDNGTQEYGNRMCIKPT